MNQGPICRFLSTRSFLQEAFLGHSLAARAACRLPLLHTCIVSGMEPLSPHTWHRSHTWTLAERTSYLDGLLARWCVRTRELSKAPDATSRPLSLGAADSHRAWGGVHALREGKSWVLCYHSGLSRRQERAPCNHL